MPRAVPRHFHYAPDCTVSFHETMSFMTAAQTLSRFGNRLRPYRGGIVLSVLAVAVALYFLVGKKEEAAPPGLWGGPVPVRLVEARHAALDVELTALGTVAPLNAVTVRSRVDGELMEVMFEEGQMVEAGALLGQIDPRSFEVALAEAECQQQQNLALLKNAEANLEMYRGLFAQDSIAKQQLDNQEALVRQYRGTVNIDQARVDNARLQLSYTRIQARIKGRLGLRKIDPGNLINSGDTDGLVTITQMDPIGVLFNLPEADLPAVLGALRSGRPLVVEVWNRAGSERIASGRLRTVDNQIDTTTGTVALKAEFNNDKIELFPNQFVNVRLRVSTLDDAVVLPTAAVQHGSAGTFIYVVQTTPVQPGKAEAAKAKSDKIQTDKVEADKGEAGG